MVWLVAIRCPLSVLCWLLLARSPARPILGKGLLLWGRNLLKYRGSTR
ncbi:MAG TPA: hypothetical protein V6C88_01350 [Chroococcidiopsis sp.]